MSRLIIKGLPSRYDDKQLRQLFAFAGEVTDAKVIKTKEGKSRKFGFIGFRTSKEAKHARHQLNKSYVDTSQVTIDFAQKIGSDSIPRPWSRYSMGSSKHDETERKSDEEFRRKFLKQEKEKREKLLKATKQQQQSENSREDHILSEFHAVTEKRSANPIWANGDVSTKEMKTLVPSRKNGANGALLERTHITFDDAENDENDDLYEDLPGTKEETVEPKINPSDADEVGNTVALDQAISDMDYFRSKVVSDNNEQKSEKKSTSAAQEPDESKLLEAKKSSSSPAENDEPEVEDEKSDESKKLNENARTEEDNLPLEDKVRQPLASKRDEVYADVTETGRLFIRNLAYSVTEEEVEELFEKYGPLADVHIVKDSMTGQSRGMGFVQFMVHENAATALVEVDEKVHSGRILRITAAKPRPESKVIRHGIKTSNGGSGSSAFKSERDEALKESARRGTDGIAQDPMHLAQDAVANVIAGKHGVSKSDLLGTAEGESGTAAVRLAIAEASLQSEARSFLLENGVNLEIAAKLSSELAANTTTAKKKRMSRKAFLVKNLPARTKEYELEKLFQKFGEINRMIVIPSGIMAVIEFSNPHSAKKAFSNLAYTRFKDTPLYLEWLPIEAIQDSKATDLEKSKVPARSEKNDHASEEIRDPTPAISERNGLTTVFVKNLNFSTRDASLRDHITKTLKRHAQLRQAFKSAKVALKPGNKGKNSESLSMGFGFLEFARKESAIEFIKLAQNSVLDGHSLQFSLSNQNTNDDNSSNKRKRKSSESKKITPKLIIRNIAFEATRKDIRQLFSTFGQLKTVRLPKKVDGSHRGFAFVEFVSKNEASAALNALTSAHLYGRHLVIEYASETSTGFASVAELQAQAAAHVSKKRIRLSSNSGKRSGDVDDNEEEIDEQAEIQDVLYG